MNICIFSHMYPNEYSSSDFVFVKKLVDEFAAQGHKCYVISPYNVLHYRHFVSKRLQYSVGDSEVVVIRPIYFSFGENSLLSGLVKISRKKALNRAYGMMEKVGFAPDVVYCHFWSAGLEAYPFANSRNLPLFVASGESSINMNNADGSLNNFCDYVKGVICVSSKNRDESLTRKLTLPEKCIVAPNAVNDAVFRKLDKVDCRKRLNIPLDKFVVAFVGWFIERKGPKRVAEAINGIASNDVYSLFIGSGEQQPECKNILFMGKVPNTELPIYLNAADAFVLPTLKEGCCNAVVEALSCGLPVISSNLPFNWDVLSEDNSILVDPNNVDEIKDAIQKLKADADLRDRLSTGALKTAANLTIEKRAKKILEFIESCL